MKKALGQAPLLKVLLPFLCGILISVFFIPPDFRLLTLNLIFFAGLLVIAARKYISPADHLAGAGPALILFGFGAANVYLHKPDIRPGFFANELKPAAFLMVRITEPLQEKPKAFKSVAFVNAVGYPGQMHAATGKIILYFDKDSVTKYPGYGDLICIQNKVQPLSPPANPGEFDYSNYMANQGIYHSAFLKPEDWLNTGQNSANLFWSAIYSVRSKIKTEISQSLHGSDETGIAEALVLGDESEIPNETISDYAGTGTLHILSVSGLHVAIILLVLNGIFGFLLRIRFGKYIRLVLILVLIWAYAFLTGFSAPIARSVIMFSIVFIGIHAGRQANIYNSICGAALILLLFDPFLLMQAGFQLSFIALTGIVWLQPKISAWWKPANRISKWIWELAAASLAAQLITFPLGVLYFNQFSNYFLPANLIIIPISFFVLGAGIIFVFARMIPVFWLHSFIGKLLYGSIYFINTVASFINRLPGSKLQGLYFNPLETIIMYLFIIFFSIALIYREKKIIFAAISFLIVFFIIRNTDEYYKSLQNSLHVLALPQKQPVITIKDRNRLYVLADSGFIADKQQMKYHINGYACQNYISPASIIAIPLPVKEYLHYGSVCFRPPFMKFYEKTFLIIDRKTSLEAILKSAAEKKEIEAVLLVDNPEISLNQLYKKCPFKTVIAAPGNPIKKTMAWETECLENNIPFVSLGGTHSYRSDI